MGGRAPNLSGLMTFCKPRAGYLISKRPREHAKNAAPSEQIPRSLLNQILRCSQWGCPLGYPTNQGVVAPAGDGTIQ